MSKDPYYWHTMHCTNCEYRTQIQIPKGVTVHQFLFRRPTGDPIVCYNCGCAGYLLSSTHGE